jgi:hypothetical protein
LGRLFGSRKFLILSFPAHYVATVCTFHFVRRALNAGPINTSNHFASEACASLVLFQSAPSQRLPFEKNVRSSVNDKPLFLQFLFQLAPLDIAIQHHFLRIDVLKEFVVPAAVHQVGNDQWIV